MRILAVVPAFNEARSLPRVVAGLRAHVPGFDVCVVDDGSTDRTAAVARDLGVTVLRSPLNLGIGGAVQTGYMWALENGYDVAVQIDGDDQHEAADAGELIEPILNGRADVVVGSRFLRAGGFRSSAVRRAGIRYLAWFLRLRCGARVTDPTSGFRAAGPRALRLFARLYPSDYPEPEAIALAVRAGLRLAEVPTRMKARQEGQSSIGAGRTLYYLVKVSLALLLLPDRASARAAAEPT